MPKPVKIRLGPFTGGINRLKARTQLSPQELWDAQGFFQHERGRLRSCWESETANSATFSAITDGTTNIEEAPRGIVYWKKAAKLTFSNRYRAQVEGLAQLVVDSASGASKKDVTLIEYNEKLWAFIDGEPLRFFSTVAGMSYDSATVQYGGGGSGATGTPPSSEFASFFSLKGNPTWIYHSYWETKNNASVTLDSSAANETYTATNINSNDGAHGSAALLKGWQYVTCAQVFGSEASPDPAQYIYSNVLWNDESSDANILWSLADLATDATDRYIRAGHPMQEVHMRYPAIFKNRLCGVEGRDYIYSKLGDDLAGYGSATSFTLTGDRSSDGTVKIGDEIIVFVVNASGIKDSKVKDYVLTGANDTQLTGPYKLTDVTFATTNTACTFVEDISSLSGMGTQPWAVRRATTSAQRRRVWFSGRPSDATNGIELDITDAGVWGTNNNVEVGTDADGDITGLFSQGDDRLIVGMDSAVYGIFAPGGLPIDGVSPPGFGVQQISGSVGVFSDRAGTFSDDGNIFYFASGTDFGIYMLYGQTTVRIDDAVRDHPNFPVNASTPKCFSHLIFSNKRLYCVTDETNPYIWILDTMARSEANPYGAWTYTKRINAGQDQTGTLAAVEISAGQTENKLYPTGDHGGLFSPYRDVPSEVDRVLVSYSDGTDYRLRSMNNAADEHNDANLLHSCKVETGTIDGGSMAPKRTRQIRALDTKPMNINSGTTTALSEIQFTLNNSEGFTSLTRTVTPERSDGDSSKYRVFGDGGRGDTGVQISLNNSTTVYSPIGELDSIEIDVIPMEYRNR